jgi:hypothetical protein
MKLRFFDFNGFDSNLRRDFLFSMTRYHLENGIFMIIYYPKKPAGKATIKFFSTVVDGGYHHPPNQ